MFIVSDADGPSFTFPHHPWWEISGEDGSLYNQDGLWLKEGWLFAALLSNRLRMSFFFFFLMLAWVDGQRRSVLFIFFLTPGPQQLNQPTSIVWTRAISLDLERDTELTGSCLRGGARPSQHVLLWPPTALLWSAAQRSCLERRRYWEEHYPSRADKECTQSKIRFHKGTKHSLWGKIHIWFTGRDTAFDWILVWTLFFYYSGTVARLYPWFFFFYEWPLHIWALCGHLAFLLHLPRVMACGSDMKRMSNVGKSNHSHCYYHNYIWIFYI